MGNADAMLALDAIEAQLHEMRSLKGWRLNLIRENLAKLKAALDHGPAQTVRVALEEIANETENGDHVSVRMRVIARKALAASPVTSTDSRAAAPDDNCACGGGDISGHDSMCPEGEFRKGRPMLDVHRVLAIAPSRRTDFHCQICGRTDKEYLHSGLSCNDPWHADAHLRAKATLVPSNQHREGES